MIHEKMTQEEDDLEEELRCLDIREDHGAEESDVTPTNTPPASPPILYIKKYPPTQPEENKDFGRFSRGDYNECRSDSSLSWGDDEFEGEATRQVSLLFDQLDSLLYEDDSFTSAVPWSLSVNRYVTEVDDKTVSPAGSIGYFSSPEIISDESVEPIIPKISKGTVFDVDDVESRTLLLNNTRLIESSSGFGSDLLVAPEPTPELLEECSNWVHHFPHIRVRGRLTDAAFLNVLEQHIKAESLDEETSEYEEEIIAEDGDYESLLPLVNYVSANQVKPSHVNPKTGTSSSRVCSGSNDPEVLKEQVLIMIFDKLWPTVTAAVEPLLHSYAKYVIEQSVQYSSLSREPSTRGARMGRQTPVRKYSDEYGRFNERYLLPPEIVTRPDSGISVRGYRANRPLSAISRPSSAVNRLHGFQSTPSIQQRELQELLQVTAKPLQNGEERLRSRTPSASLTRDSSARSSLSSISLPSVTTPRTTVQRPVSSRMARHLTPIRADSVSSTLEQRPASTSSYNARSRFQEKFHHLSRHGTIQEISSNVSTMDIEEEPSEFTSPTWSRHISFLPPIADRPNSAVMVRQTNGGPVISRQNSTSRRSASVERSYQASGHDTLSQSLVMTGEDTQLSSLTVRGTTLSAAHRPHALAKSKKQTWGTPIIDGSRNRKLIRSHQK